MSRTAQRHNDLNTLSVVATRNHTNAQPALQRQVYLLETHPGALCRVLDLYAARPLRKTLFETRRSDLRFLVSLTTQFGLGR